MKDELIDITVVLDPASAALEQAADVALGLRLRPRQLPSKWLYDPVGCDLFDEITALPEYYLTRAERAILSAYAGEMLDICGADTLVELGSGSSDKTRALLDALVETGRPAGFVAFDVAAPILHSSLDALHEEYPELSLGGVVGDFGRDLRHLPEGGRRMVAFLGSTVGNFEAAERESFFAQLAAVLRPGESLLLGADLVKDPSRILDAYDDSAGVTAAFEKNALAVVNATLAADFDLERFNYVVCWDSEEERVEMGVSSLGAQSVNVAGLGMEVELMDGEEIRTEVSAKFRPDALWAELADAGFDARGEWTDPNGDFLVLLATRGQR